MLADGLAMQVTSNFVEIYNNAAVEGLTPIKFCSFFFLTHCGIELGQH